MVNIFITDSADRFERSREAHKILYLEGFIRLCNFVNEKEIDSFNNSLVGLEDEASRLMLIKLDEDTQTIINRGLKFNANRFISALPEVQKIHSNIFKFHQLFVLKKYLFELVLDRFFTHFAIPEKPLNIEMSENYSLTQDSPFEINSAKYYSLPGGAYLKFLEKQVYYLGHRLLHRPASIQRTEVAIFLYDIHNEFDLFKTFMQLAKKENKLKITVIVVDSGNAAEKKVDTNMYTGNNVNVVYLYAQKANLITNYESFYDVCQNINPLYKIFKKSRLCEIEDIQYGFVNNVLTKLSPQVCLYANVQEFGRIVANVCAAYNIPAIAVEYAFPMDTHILEKRIRFDLRACISEVTAQNWIRHKDPTPRHEVIGFCKIDDWKDKLAIRNQSHPNGLFDNNKRTILFVSTWAPNPNSPLLTEKAKIVDQLSEICFRNGWNFIVKKHPSEFDTFVNEVFTGKNYPNQKIMEHSEMNLFDCVYYSDFVCTQNSSAFIETLYLNKPFSFVTISGQNTWADLTYFSHEKVVGNFGSMQEYEKYIIANEKDETYQYLLEEFQKLQVKYLYKIDGKASERLLELTASFVKS